MITNLVWYFLADAKIIKDVSLLKMFNYNAENSTKFLFEATNYYFKSVNESIKFANKNDYIIWHLGAGKMLMELIMNYKTKNI